MSADVAVPDELRRAARWVTWDLVADKKLPAGRAGREGWQLPENWLSFDEASARGERLGFVLGDGFSGLDLDDCLDPVTRSLRPAAEDIVHRTGSYAEVSPSGTGLKIFGLSSLPGVEVRFHGGAGLPKVNTFTGARYFTVTGDSVNVEPLKDVTAEIRFWADVPGDRKASDPLPAQVAEGGRNAMLFREGCRLRRLGWDEPEIVAGLLAINRQRCRPSLDEREVAVIAGSCARYQAAADNFPLTETGDAEFFAACNADLVRYDHRRGRWLLFDQHHWTPQTDGEVHRLAREAIRARQAAAQQLPDDHPQRLARLRWAVAGEARSRQTNMLALAQTVKPVADSGAEWDTDPWLLGVPNGIVDLRTGLLRSGRPEDRVTMRARAPYDPDAACPLWDGTIGEIFGGDAELIAYVDRLIGYSLTGDSREEILALLWGGGANGKGTLMNTLGWVLGDYADDLPFSALELDARSSIPNDIAKIVGKRFVTSSESGEARRLNEARVKALTGRDPITARFLHREFFTFQPVAKFWLASNHKPVVRDTTIGFWRRLHLVPFTRSFADKPDLQLKDKLRAEAAGILARAVRGCLAWQREGLKPPAVVLEATDTYRTDSLPLARFLSERCVLQGDARSTFGALFADYLRWCATAREQTRLGRHEFSEALRERFQVDPATKRNVTFMGIGLVDPYAGEGL